MPENEQILNELISRQRSVFTLSDEKTRKILILLLQKVRQR
jgi:hypothetical protein